MLKSLVVLGIAGTMSVPAAAQPAQTPPATNPPQQAKPQMVKKRVCEESDNAFSRLKTRMCRTVMAPAQPAATSNQTPGSAPAPQQSSGN